MERIVRLLFSFEGRMSRRPYLVASSAVLLMSWTIAVVVAILDPSLTIAAFVAIPLSIPLWWSLAALAAKRLHDLNRSAKWLWLWIVPFANAWLAIRLFLVRGTVGSNAWGNDPLAQTKIAAA